MNAATHHINLPDEAATLALGRSLAAGITLPLVVYLYGGLGAGKTTFTRGLLRGLGYAGNVKSPTYAIVESYELAGLNVHHFDLYRFSSPEEWDDAGLGDLFSEHSVCLIEWPQQAEGLLPPADLTIELAYQSSGRECRISAHTEHGNRNLAAWTTHQN